MIPFHDKETGAFPYTEAQTAEREKLGQIIAKQVQAALTAQAADPNTVSHLGAHITEARSKGTEAQAKKWAKRGRTMMVELAIPVPALTVAVPGGTLKTKPYTMQFNAILDTPQPAEEKKPAAEKPVPQVRALTYQEILARQAATRKQTAPVEPGTIQ